MLGRSVWEADAGDSVMEMSKKQLIEGDVQVNEEKTNGRLGPGTNGSVAKHGMSSNILMESQKFEEQIEAYMNTLEEDDILFKSDDDEENIRNISEEISLGLRKKVRLPRNKRTQRTSAEALSTSSSEASDDEDIVAVVNQKSPLRTPEALNHHQLTYPIPQIPRPFIFTIERRRLSQCKEEEEEDNPDKTQSVSPTAVSIPPASASSPPAEGTIVNRFTVTKAEQDIVPKAEDEKKEQQPPKEKEEEKQEIPKPNLPRPEMESLRSYTKQQNSQTIHFPCSSPTVKPNLQSIFSPLNPHLDKKFFDTSLIEIRPITESTKSLNQEDSIDSPHEVWVRRTDEPKRPPKSVSSAPILTKNSLLSHSRHVSQSSRPQPQPCPN